MSDRTYVVVWNGRRDTDPYLAAQAEAPKPRPTPRRSPPPVAYRSRDGSTRFRILRVFRDADAPLSVRDVEVITGCPHATVFMAVRRAYVSGLLHRVGQRQDTCRHYVSLYKWRDDDAV